MCRRFPTGRHVAQFQSADLSAHSTSRHCQFGGGEGFYVTRASEKPDVSPIHFAPMPDTMHPHDANDIGNLINHAVIADTDAPVAFCAGQFPAAGRSRVAGQSFYRLDDPVMDFVR